MQNKTFFAWLIFIVIAALLGSMAVCNAVAMPLPRLDVEPFIGVAMHISPRNPNIRVVDSIGGTDLLEWYRFRLGIGGTSYSWGIVISRQVWILPFLDAGFHGGHIWGSEPHWVVAGVVVVRW